MISKYWINKRTREWGIVESGSGRSGAGFDSVGWGESLPKSQELLDRLEETEFVLLNRIEFLLLSKALDERGEPLAFSPLPPEGPAPAILAERIPRRPVTTPGMESFSFAA